MSRISEGHICMIQMRKVKARSVKCSVLRHGFAIDRLLIEETGLKMA